jgi:hypothetical protein
MNRPTRKLAHLVEKVSLKQARSPNKAGRRTKRWKKWIETYKALAPSS